LKYLKKAEEQEKGAWYYHMVKGQFAYVGAYRKCIDDMEHLKRSCGTSLWTQRWI